MKVSLRHKDYCDGCEELITLNTMGQHRQCKKYLWTKLPDEASFIINRGAGYIERPQKCKDENDTEIRR